MNARKGDQRVSGASLEKGNLAKYALELDGKLYCPLMIFVEYRRLICAIKGQQLRATYTAFGELRSYSHTLQPPFNPWRFASKRF